MPARLYLEGVFVSAVALFGLTVPWAAEGLETRDPQGLRLYVIIAAALVAMAFVVGAQVRWAAVAVAAALGGFALGVSADETPLDENEERNATWRGPFPLNFVQIGGSTLLLGLPMAVGKGLRTLAERRPSRQPS